MSIGWTDGGPHIWVASDYGFFELVHPSPDYAPVYNSMMQAITLYYTVQGIYEAASTTGGKEMSLDEVLFQVCTLSPCYPLAQYLTRDMRQTSMRSIPAKHS